MTDPLEKNWEEFVRASLKSASLNGRDQSAMNIIKTNLVQLIQHIAKEERRKTVEHMREIATINRDSYTGKWQEINEHVLLFLADYSEATLEAPNEGHHD